MLKAMWQWWHCCSNVQRVQGIISVAVGKACPASPLWHLSWSCGQAAQPRHLPGILVDSCNFHWHSRDGRLSFAGLAWGCSLDMDIEFGVKSTWLAGWGYSGMDSSCRLHKLHLN